MATASTTVCERQSWGKLGQTTAHRQLKELGLETSLVGFLEETPDQGTTSTDM